MSQVLVVDDEPQVRDLARRALNEVNLTCHTAPDGVEALKRCEARRYDAVVTDLRMPQQHGHALALDLLSRPCPPSVVVMTGDAEQRLVHDLMSRGVEDIFWKPVDYHVLALKLLSLIDRKNRGYGFRSPANQEGALQRLGQVEQTLMEITTLFNDSLASVFDFDFEVNKPPKAVTDFIDRFAKAEQEAAELYAETEPERREKERLACPSSATAVPVDRQFARQGAPFMAAIRDVSESGIRLLHTRATNAQYLALSWKAESLAHSHIRVVIKVNRCQPMSPFYDISGDFVMADC